MLICLWFVLMNWVGNLLRKKKLRLVIGKNAKNAHNLFTTSFNPGRRAFMTVRKAAKTKKIETVEKYFSLKPSRPRLKAGKRWLPKKKILNDARSGLVVFFFFPFLLVTDWCNVRYYVRLLFLSRLCARAFLSSKMVCVWQKKNWLQMLPMRLATSLWTIPAWLLWSLSTPSWTPAWTTHQTWPAQMRSMFTLVPNSEGCRWAAPTLSSTSQCSPQLRQRFFRPVPWILQVWQALTSCGSGPRQSFCSLWRHQSLENASCETKI